MLESRLWHQSASRQRQREDDLSRRIAALSAISTRGISGRKSKHLDSDEDDDLLVGAQPQQVTCTHPWYCKKKSCTNWRNKKSAQHFFHPSILLKT